MKQLWIAGLVVLLGAPVQAAPLDSAHVAEDAKWVLHFDFDAARESTYAERFRDEQLDEPNVQAGLNFLKERYGIDPREDLHGLTAYGVSYEPHTGAVVLRADFDRDKVLEIVREQEGYRTETHGDYTIHVWTADKEADEPRQAAAAIYDDKTAVLGSPVEKVRRALDVLDGEQASLAKDSPLVAEILEGTVFYGAAVDLEGLEAREGFHVLQQADKITAAFGEHEGRTFLKGSFVAESEDVAHQVRDLMEGLRAIVALQLHEQPQELQRIVRAIEVGVDDQTVNVSWRVETEQLMKLGDEIQRRQRERLEEADEPAVPTEPVPDPTFPEDPTLPPDPTLPQ